jgi:integrase
MAAHEPCWKNVRHRQQWRTTMKEFVYPRLGDKITDDIETEHILNVLEPVWMKTPETASRVRGRIEVVLDWAKARGLRDGDNPARWRGHLANLLPKVSKVAPVKHLPAMAFDEVPAFVAELRSIGSHTALALELLVLTATRANETLGATWSEFDLEKKVWCIPAARMKAGREHRVPLSDRVIEILKEVESVRQTALVFPGLATGRPLRSNAVLRVLKRMQRDGVTVHGFRSSFRDWAAETTNFQNHVVEMALAHAVENKVEGAYRRGDLFEKRRKLMDAWGAYIEKPRGIVVLGDFRGSSKV